MTPFPLGEDCPVEHGSPLPDAVDVAIVGGGIIGVMSAYFLARKGLRVVLLEKGRVGAEQSARNWGWIRQQGRDMAELPIMTEANRLWAQLARETGEDLGLATVGVSYLAENEAELAGFESWLTDAKTSGVDSRMVTGREAADLMPNATRNFAGGLYTASDMKAEPWVAVPALARLAARAGAIIVENCAVRGLDIEAGRIAGVITERGRVKARDVVVAGGAWSSLLLRRHGIKIPQLSVQSVVLATTALPDIKAPATALADVAFRRRADGGYTVAAGGWHRLHIGPDALRALPKYISQLRQDWRGTRYSAAAPRGYPDGWSTPRNWALDQTSPFEQMRVLNPPPKLAPLRGAIKEFEKLFPQLGPVGIKTAWGGMIDTMPDIVPVVDSAPDVAGLHICTGMCGHGFGIGPAFGRIMADMVSGDAVGHDLSRFRLSRFSDGSKMVLGPSL